MFLEVIFCYIKKSLNCDSYFVHFPKKLMKKNNCVNVGGGLVSESLIFFNSRCRGGVLSPLFLYRVKKLSSFYHIIIELLSYFYHFICILIALFYHYFVKMNSPDRLNHSPIGRIGLSELESCLFLGL